MSEKVETEEKVVKEEEEKSNESAGKPSTVKRVAQLKKKTINDSASYNKTIGKVLLKFEIIMLMMQVED
jgi:hypothetical protein